MQQFLKSTEVEDFIDYQKNKMLKRAIERNLEIIGEAMNRIIKRDPKFINHLPESKSIIGLRNQVIHAYDNISDENIWSILIRHLPELEKEIKALITDS
nr:HepT-like ribonuclease domain-containing protein [Rhodonellum ikkaensis]